MGSSADSGRSTATIPEHLLRLARSRCSVTLACSHMSSPQQPKLIAASGPHVKPTPRIVAFSNAPPDPLTLDCPLYFGRGATGPLKTGGCADPTTPLLCID
jgi:hypothetical protein